MQSKNHPEIAHSIQKSAPNVKMRKFAQEMTTLDDILSPNDCPSNKEIAVILGYYQSKVDFFIDYSNYQK